MAASDSYVSNLYADALAASVGSRAPASREIFWSVVVLLETCLDFFIASGSAFVALRLLVHSVAGAGSTQRLVFVSMAGGLATAWSLRSVPTRRWAGTLLQICETERILRASIQGSCFLFLAALLAGIRVSGTALVVPLMLLLITLIALRRGFSAIICALCARGYGADRVVIYGAAETARQMASTLMRTPHHRLCPVGLIFDEDVPPIERLFRAGDGRLRPIAVAQAPVSAAFLHSLRCELLIVAAAHLSPDQIDEFRDIAGQALASIAVVQNPGSWTESIDAGGVQLLSDIQPLASWHFAFVKRAADIVLSLVLLVLLAPLMLLIALLICMDSPGPVFFVQERVGRNGRLFPIFKFRSMHVTASAYDCSPTEPRDPRVTRMGRLLRRAGLDELPQLLNVLLGHMSLVGPRPEMPFLVERYRDEHRPRLQVSPGITGLWQLSADRALPIHENTQYDLYYIRNRTLCMDWAILLHTLLFAIRGGA